MMVLSLLRSLSTSRGELRALEVLANHFRRRQRSIQFLATVENLYQRATRLLIGTPNAIVQDVDIRLDLRPARRANRNLSSTTQAETGLRLTLAAT